MDDLSSVLAWQNFLNLYAQGGLGAESTPPIPPIPPEIGHAAPSQPWKPDHGPLYSTAGSISLDDARAVREFYRVNQYLPPPRSPLESHRHACINEHDLCSANQLSNIQSALDVICAFFTGAFVTFTLFHNHVQTCFAASGDEKLLRQYQVEVGQSIQSEDSLCGHAVLHEGGISIFADLKDDWRFRNHPNTLSGHQSFVGSSVSIQLDPLAQTPTSRRVVVGTVNICFINEAITSLTSSQRSVIRHVTAMLETQLRATWEGGQRTKEGRARKILSDLIDDALISQESDDGREDLRRVARTAMEKLCELLPDVQNMVLVNTGSVPDHNGSYIADVNEPYEVSAYTGDPIRPSQAAVLACVNTFRDPTVFSESVKSGLESYFPQGTKSHLVLPLRCAERLLYLLIATSPHSEYSFPSIDVNIIRSVGSVLRAKALQRRVILADAAQTSFLSSISHELRTPMHGVQASLDMLRNTANGRDWSRIEEPLKMAESSGRALLNILNDLLDFGKASWDPAEAAKVDLAKSAEEIASMCLAHYGQSMGEKGTIRLEVEDRDWGVKVNEARYQRIITNGLTNALKFCPDGEIVISLRATLDNSAVILQIQDSGTGISPESLPRLMQPFTKLNPHTPGAGLGLYITRSLVEKMGGELSLKSAIGSGTTFSATLPLILPSHPTPPPPMLVHDLRNPDASPSSAHYPTLKRKRSASTPPSLQSTQTAPRPLKILIIDDNEVCRGILRMALLRAKIPVALKEAENGQIGLDTFATFHPDIVLTDVSMPVMDGVTAAGKMRELLKQQEPKRNCVIYALTGLGSSDPRTQSIGVNGTAAMDGWLVKGKDMLAAVYKVLDGFERDDKGGGDGQSYEMKRAKTSEEGHQPIDD